jgi:hypothetical protein
MGNQTNAEFDKLSPWFVDAHVQLDPTDVNADSADNVENYVRCS